MSDARRRALRLAALVLLGALLVVFGRRVDWPSVGLAVRTADPRLLAVAVMLNLLSLVLKGVRWWVFLRALGEVPLSLVLRATFAGASLNNLLVAQGGEGARVLLVSRAAGISSAGVLAALTIERALDMVSYLVLLVGAAWLLPLPPHIARWRLAAAALLALAALMLATLGVVARHARRLPVSVEPLVKKGRVASYLQRMRSGGALVASPARLTAAMLLSLAAWALQVGTYHVTALAAHLPLSVAGSVAAMLAVGISFLVRATPGNLGVFQVIYAFTVRSFGVAEGPAVAVALLIQTLQVVPTVVAGSLTTSALLRGTRVDAR